MDNKTDRTELFRKFLSGPALDQIKTITSEGRAVTVRTPDGAAWGLKKEETNKLIAEYAEGLKTAVSGATIVIFRPNNQNSQ